MYSNFYCAIFLTLFCTCLTNPVKNEASPNPIRASKLTSYPIIISDIQASDLFDAHFPVFLTIGKTKVEFSRTEWTADLIFKKLVKALNQESLEKFCVNFSDEGIVEFTKDERSISVLLLRAIKEDNHLTAYQC